MEGFTALDSVNPNRTERFTFPAELSLRAPRTIRFCVRASDPSANESEQSCARFTFKKRKRLL